MAKYNITGKLKKQIGSEYQDPAILKQKYKSGKIGKLKVKY